MSPDILVVLVLMPVLGVGVDVDVVGVIVVVDVEIGCVCGVMWCGVPLYLASATAASCVVASGSRVLW